MAVKVTQESDTGRNTKFSDGSKKMTRAGFVREIEHGNYDNYHVRNINGIKTPVSNPDGNTNNNLG